MGFIQALHRVVNRRGRIELIGHRGRNHPNFAITSPNSTSSLGNCFGVAKGFDTHVSLIRSRHVMLLLVPLPPHEPQPSEKVCRIPFHKLPLFDADCGWLTITRLVRVALANFMMFASDRE